MSKYIGAHADEVFLGNVQMNKGVPDYLAGAGIKTLRLGDKALDIDGNYLPDHQPMFICRSESDTYNRIMMKLTFPNQKVW